MGDEVPAAVSPSVAKDVLGRKDTTQLEVPRMQRMSKPI